MDCSRATSSFLASASELPEGLLEILRHGANEQFLDALSSAALNSRYTSLIFSHFKSISLELCTRWSKQDIFIQISAFGRILIRLPHLLELASNLLITNNPPQGILHTLFAVNADDNALNPATLEAPRLREILLALLRLLSFDNPTFAQLIKPAHVQLCLYHQDASIRYLAVRILCLYVHASDGVLQSMVTERVGTAPCTGTWENQTVDYIFLDLWEEKLTRDFHIELNTIQGAIGSEDAANTHIPSRTLLQKDLSPGISLTNGLLLMRRTGTPENTTEQNAVVITPTTKQNLELVTTALAGTAPILLTGLAGSGKTMLVKHLAAELNMSSSMVTLHLNEQSDAKLLIGIYTTGSQPGSFKWQPGVLTTAVTEGRWVFIEDLDRAPNEVISVILPLIERRQLVIPSRGETITAAHGFKIIATMRTQLNLRGEESLSGARILGYRFWRTLSIKSLSIDELQQIIESRFSLLVRYVPGIMAVYHRLRKEFVEAPSSSRNHVFRARPISTREVFKWCSRMQASLRAAGSRDGTEAMPQHVLDGMYLDAVDCLVGSLEEGELRNSVISSIAEEMHVDEDRKLHLLRDRTIEVRQLGLTNVGDTLRVGRTSLACLPIRRRPVSTKQSPFALTNHTQRLLEQVAVAVSQREPLLLVGETGIGKTTAVQHLAARLGQDLLAINLSQQSETGDLLGGFKPVNIRSLIIPLKDEFDLLFDDTFSSKKNAKFVETLNNSIAKGKWKATLTVWKQAITMAERVISTRETDSATPPQSENEQKSKRRKFTKISTFEERLRWEKFTESVRTVEIQVTRATEAFAFTFAEGKFVEAVRNGGWVLLDEINLAPADTLECISDLLEEGIGSAPSLLLTETGNAERIHAHPNFRLFAAMNPATDVGKRDLPTGIRSRFTEIYVNSPDKDIQSLRTIVETYLKSALRGVNDRKLVLTVADLYMEIQRLVGEAGLVDGANQKPHYSLRTLSRALSHAVAIVAQCNLGRALYEGFCMCFLTYLNAPSEECLQQLFKTRLFGTATQAARELKRPLREPDDGRLHVTVSLRVEAVGPGANSKEQYFLPKGELPVEDPNHYIITPFVRRNLQNLIRATSTRKYPVLIQGPTSAGKTSMIEYLAKRSGNKFVRINNHEHTDLQEYLGTYVSTSDGKLVFQEGILVQAVRAGHWVVLDELNLAPTDVLEALNRLLDDNRELLIPETQEIVRPHPSFMLFATQNPVGPYGGRKVLSRAFRNRFLELHFDDIPVSELNVILSRRSDIPESWCGLIVEVYTRLSQLRQENRLFEQNSFATLRDLFRWALRGADTVEDLATNGYLLLAEKVRKAEERNAVKEVIEQVMNRKGVRVRIDDEQLYTAANYPEMQLYPGESQNGVVWTKAMRRLYCLVSHALRNNEAVLLVGETGCGKTSVCQMLAQAMSKTLHIVNAHQNTETGDLIGAQRPIRNRGAVAERLRTDLLEALHTLDINDTPAEAEADTDALLKRLGKCDQQQVENIPVELRRTIEINKTRHKALFEWCDGSLVQAMRAGQFYLLDEISLGDDSVLERINSLLDPQRSILLAEKGTDDSLVTAQAGFQFFATMNPGGDFGKKELSPALRNRFTEIWVPHLSDTDDVVQIIRAKIKPDATGLVDTMVAFAKWFSQHFRSASTSISIRDILAWVDFINRSSLQLDVALVQGAAMVYIDTLGANPSALIAVTQENITEGRLACLWTLKKLMGQDIQEFYHMSLDVVLGETEINIGPFSIPTSGQRQDLNTFNFEAPTTKTNAMRIVRALQVSKPILLEGSPGVGKTAIITAIAGASGNPLVRINLSEQTDLMDLFGSDAPVTDVDGPAGEFAWRDAPFLAAMKQGNWVLLDEMNLASQSVLEGLNACLDHRGEVYIAELDQTFTRHPQFRLFAAQNPHHQGGGRKGLPASFVNRFTVVYADVFQQNDLLLICKRVFPTVDDNLISKLVSFVSELEQQVVTHRTFGARGSPWEFNLRDSLRWLQLLSSTSGVLPGGSARDFLDILFTQRFRLPADERAVRGIFHRTFGPTDMIHNHYTNFSSRTVQVGYGILPRSLVQASASSDNINLKHRLPLVESLMLCVQQNWPVILVGPTGAGKTVVLQSLASLVGADLEIFGMSADIDATDLVGGYEQVDPSRHQQAFVLRLETSLRYELALLMMNNADPVTSQSSVTNLLTLLEKVARKIPSTDDLVHIRASLQDLAMRHQSGALAERLRECETVLKAPRAVQMARFEWIDGMLVRALEQGRWLVLDNANLCSSSVLDRLNSLLEPNGSLIINEHCSEDGLAKVVHPHPNFRIFLTMDPQYGEVSRAMRNRAVELFVAPLSLSEMSIETPFYALYGNSTMQHYRALVSMVNEDVDPLVVQRFMESFSLRDMQLLKQFNDQAGGGLIAAKYISSLTTARDRFDLLSHLLPSWSIQSLEYYSFAQIAAGFGADFGNVQSMHTLSNQPLVALSEACTSPHNATFLGRRYDLLLDLARFEQALHIARERSASTDSMNRLQRSFAASRIANATKDSTSYAALFFQNVKAIVVGWVDTHGQSDKSSIKLMQKIQALVWTLFKTVTSAEFEEATFQMFLTIFREAVGRARVQEDTTTPLIAISKELDGFKAKSRLTTGLGMESIWNLARPITASSNERLAAVLQLQQFAKSFDNMVWRMKAPLLELADLRGAIIQALSLATMEDLTVESLLAELEKAVVEIGEPLEANSETPRPYFSAVFEAIAQYSDWDTTTNHGGARSQQQNMLTMLACRQTRTATSSTERPLSQSLESLGKYLGFAGLKNTNLVLRNSLPLDVLKQIATSGGINLRQMDLLLTELPVLATSVATGTLSLCRNQLEPLHEVMQSICQFVIQDHRQSEEYIGDKEREQYFNSIEEQYLQSLSNVRSDSLEAIADGFLRLGLGCLLLYVPDRPRDPALGPLIKQRVHRAQLQSMAEKLNELKFLEDRQTGQKVNLRIIEVETDMEELGLEPEAVAIARPPSSQLENLQVDFNSSLLIVRRIQAYVAQGELDTISDPGLLDNITRIIIRLSTGYHAYTDITGPAIGFLQCLRMGMILTSEMLKLQQKSSKEVAFLVSSSPFLTSHPESWVEGACIRPSAYPRGNTKLQLHTLAVLALRAQAEKPSKWPEYARISCLEAFDSLYATWKNTLTEEQKKAAANSSLYTYRGSQDDEDDDLESDFQSMFPVYDEDETEGSDAGEGIPEKIQLGNPQDNASEVARLHIEIFSSSHAGVFNDKVQALIESSTAQLSKLPDTQTAQSNTNIPQMMPAIMLALEKTSANFSADAPVGGKYNAYTDSNIGEVKKIIALVYQIQDFFRPIREIWPEHATLSDVIRCGDELLLFKPVDSIMKILTKAEKLHDYIAEWQSVTSKEHSAIVVFNKLTDLLISWRQLELSTWAKLMSLETDRCETDARSWWYIAYESVVAIPLSLDISENEMTKHAIDLSATLTMFMSSSTCGQYTVRLQLLRSLLNELWFLGPTTATIRPIIAMLRNFLDHYNRFSTSIQETLVTGRKPIETSIREVIQLASWRDRNISILKQSVRASHRKLFRCVRKYRALLGKPVRDLLGREASASVLNSDVARSLTSQGIEIVTPAEAVQLCESNVETWKTRPMRFKNVSATVNLMRGMVQYSSRDLDAPQYVDDFLDSLTESVIHLRKVTPATLTEDNATTVKHLTSRKRKLFADTLKELRSMGVNSNLSATALASQDSLSKVLGALPSLPVSLSSTASLEAKTSFHNALDLMDNVRHSLREHSDDLNQAEINRSIGHLEGLLALVIKQRQALSVSMSHVETLDTALEKASNLWNLQGCQAITATLQNNRDSTWFGSVTTWLPHMITFGAHVLNVQAKLGHLDFSQIIAELETWVANFNEKRVVMSTQPRLAGGLIHKDVPDLITCTQADLESFRAVLERFGQEKPDAKVILDHIMIWTQYASPSLDLNTNGHLSLSAQHMDDNILSSLDSILGSMQDVEKAIKVLPLSTDLNAWLVQEDNAQSALLAAFHAPRISGAIENILDNLKNLPSHKSGDFQSTCASVVVALPILQQYHVSLSQAVERYLSLHRAVSTMTYKLAKTYCQLASQGFCKPKEQEKGSKGGDDKLEAGTGLGEGEGAEDISKDVADDEDLSELAQNPDDSMNNKEMEGEDDAVDIDDELAGGAADGMKEDAEKEEGAKKEEEDGEQGQAEEGDAEGGAQEDGTDEVEKDGMDEGVGDVDDLGPSAVDEKLWDQAGDEEAKEKEGKQSAGETNEDEQAAGGKDEEKRNSKEEGQDGEQIEGDDDDASEMSEGEDNAALPDTDNTMDPHVKDTEGLDLPDELQLDGDKGEDQDEDGQNMDDNMFDDDLVPEEERDGPGDKMEEDDIPQDVKEDIEPGAADQEDAGDQMQEPEDPEQNMEPSTYDSNPNADETTNEPSGGGDANQSEEQAEQATNEADARNAGPEQASEEKSQSESNAQRATGAESQSDSKRDQGTTEASTTEMPKSQESKDREAVKKLGNILEKWHRQHKPIQEPGAEQEDGEQDKRDDIDMADADFEHLPDEDAEADTQALGAATQDQATALDDTMAFPSELPEKPTEPQKDVPESGKEALTMAEDVEMDDIDDTEAGLAEGQANTANKSVIGERKDDMSNHNEDDQIAASDEEDVLDTIDSHLSTINISAADPDSSDFQAQWQTISNRTLALSALLTSHLRLILAPTLATKLRGDFRTGKRLNIKRIIPYIASSYKRDKIWMRRSIPSKRAYQVLLAIDDSKSMGENGSAALAFDTLALTARALATLEVGEFGVVGFGDGTFVAHELGAPWTDGAGARCIQAFGFQQTRTNVQRLVAESIRLFREARIKSSGGGGGAADLWQLQLIISDGICEDHEGIRRLLLQAQEERIMIVFVIVDAANTTASRAALGDNARSQSILDLERVEFLQVGEGDAAEMKLERKKYLQSFPFKYYLIVKDVNELPGVLSTALRQWFAEVVERG